MQIYRGHVLVCAGTGCVSSGSRKVKAEMEKAYVEKRKYLNFIHSITQFKEQEKDGEL